MKKLLFLIIAAGAGFAWFGKTPTAGDTHTKSAGFSLPSLAFIKEVPFVRDSPLLNAALSALMPAAAAPAQIVTAAPAQTYPQMAAAGGAQVRQAPAMPQVTNPNGTFAVPAAGGPSAAPKTGIAAYQDQLTAVAKALK